MAKERVVPPKCNTGNQLCGMVCQPEEWRCRDEVSEEKLSSSLDVISKNLSTISRETPEDKVKKAISDLLDGRGTYEQAIELYDFTQSIKQMAISDKEVLDTFGPKTLLATLKTLGIWGEKSKVQSADKSLYELLEMTSADPNRYMLGFRAIEPPKYLDITTQDIFDDFKNGNSQGFGYFGDGQYFAATNNGDVAPDDYDVEAVKYDSAQYGNFQWGAAIDATNSITYNNLVDKTLKLKKILGESLPTSLAEKEDKEVSEYQDNWRVSSPEALDIIQKLTNPYQVEVAKTLKLV